MLAHGITGGTLSELQGGNFALGFASQGISKATGGWISDNVPGEYTGQVVASAVVGGTVSKIGGGRFANGAVTGAFGHIFNQIASNNIQKAQERKQETVIMIEESVLDARLPNDPDRTFRDWVNDRVDEANLTARKNGVDHRFRIRSFRSQDTLEASIRWSADADNVYVLGHGSYNLADNSDGFRFSARRADPSRISSTDLQALVNTHMPNSTLSMHYCTVRWSEDAFTAVSTALNPAHNPRE